MSDIELPDLPAPDLQNLKDIAASDSLTAMRNALLNVVRFLADRAKRAPGFVMVPMEPTVQMAQALIDYKGDDELQWPDNVSPNFALAAYRIMLAAAPTTEPPSQPEQAEAPSEWQKAYAAFQAAFDNPVARHKQNDEYAQDARRRMRELNKVYLATQPTARNAGEREEKLLRKLLAIRVAGAALYGDDGELQDNSVHPCIDFKRDSAEEIERKLLERNRAALAQVPEQVAGDSGRLIERSEVVSQPGAAIKVTQLHLSQAGRDALSSNSDGIKD